MANRLLPFRQYNEHFVINLFALKTSELALTDVTENTHTNSGKHDAGVIVKITTAGSDIGAGYGGIGANAGKGDSDLNGYLGKTDYPHVGRNVYSEAFAKIEQHGGEGARPLGITLNQTLTYDENGEKMLYYKQKLLELQGVLPGEVVPVLTKGIVTLSEDAFDNGETYDAGDRLYVGGTGQKGKFTNEIPTATTYANPIGYVVAVGDRNLATGKLTSNDYFAGDGSAANGTGKYLIVNIDL
tara:strand:- start:7465 stop:8190 length:726 start_codon:yes stop_codon:yes gene_type:complete